MNEHLAERQLSLPAADSLHSAPCRYPCPPPLFRASAIPPPPLALSPGLLFSPQSTTCPFFLSRFLLLSMAPLINGTLLVGDVRESLTPNKTQQSVVFPRYRSPLFLCH